MIVAEFYKQADGKIIGFSVDGHANFGGKGFDIYCAATSMMSQSTYLCIRDHLKREFIWDADSGRLMMRLNAPPDDLTEVSFQTMLIGMKELEKLNPKLVKVKVKNFLGGDKQ